MKAFADMSESELRRARARADRERSEICDAMIAAERGFEKAWDTLAKARGANLDELTKRFAANSAEFGAIIAEEDRRREWHGSLKRIRSNTA